MSSKTEMINISTEVHWQSFSQVLKEIAHDKARQNQHSDPNKVANSFNFGALLCDSTKDFKVRAVPVNSNFADSKPTAMVTTGELYEFLINREYDREKNRYQRSNVSDAHDKNNMLWLMDLMWLLIEKNSRGVMFLGGDLKECRARRSYYSTLQPLSLLSKRYTKLYPTKKWLRERITASANNYEGLTEEETTAFTSFEPVNPILMAVDILYPYDAEKIREMPKYKRRKNLPTETEWRSKYTDPCLRTELLKMRNKMEENNA
tara:strand:+ start:309 stop:1094 length:786 start_codon:yes stop_codon:yes gene_type:complete